MKRMLPLAAALAALAGAPLAAQTEPLVEPSATAPQAVLAAELTTEQFVNTATVSNAFEIGTSQLALSAAAREDVRAFAQRMIDDHTTATTELAAAAEAAGTSAPEPYLDARHEAMVALLTGSTPETLDDAYLEMQLNAHVEAITLFTAYSDREDPLGAFAAETLPALRMHETMVRELIAAD